MSRHDYSQSTVSAVSDAILNCKSTVENTVLSVGSMPYSWDSGIINNIVTWFEVLQICDSKDELRNMFEKAESRFSSTVQDIGNADSGASGSLENGLDSLRAFREKIGVLEEYSVQSVEAAGVFENLHGLLLSIAEKYNKIDFDKLTEKDRRVYYEQLIAKENLTEDDKRKIQDYLDYLQNKFIVDGNMTEEEKMFIVLYEKLHEDYEAKKMNKFFENSSKDGIGDVDKFNIKYIAYTSQGNCHDLFFEYIDKCHVVDWNNKKEQKYDSDKGIFLDISGDGGLADKIGAYSTFFHEIGHNIDDLMSDDSYFSFEVNDGKFYEMLCGDVERNFNDSINNYNNNEAWFSIKEKGQQKILDVLMGHADQSSLNYRLSFAYRKILEDYIGCWRGVFSKEDILPLGGVRSPDGKLVGDNNYQISDITGGITNNNVVGDIKHSNYSWYYYIDENGNNIDINKDGTINNEDGLKKGEIISDNVRESRKQNGEFFAEYFAYEMTGDKDEANAREYFKDSYKVMDEAVAKKAEEIRNTRSN